MSLLHGQSASRALQEIRPRAQEVAQQAQHVVVVRERLQALAREFERPPGPEGIGVLLDHDLLLVGAGLDTVAYFVTLGAVRFGSGYHASLAKRADLSVGQTLLLGLTERFRTGGPIEPGGLARVTSVDCAAWFGQSHTEQAHVELMELFARSLRDLGRMLCEQYPGGFEALVDGAGGSAVRLVEIMVQMPYFADAQRYRGLDVPFLLRAQRIAIDLAQAFELSGYGHFTDIDLLAPSADNVIPHILRVEGVLRYDRGLVERIDRGDPVPAHTEREVEIRAAAIHAVDLIVAELRSSGTLATDIQVDAWLRARGRAPQFRSRPRHRSRTVLY